MENMEKSSTIKKIVLTDSDLVSLISTAGFKPDKTSPLAQISGASGNPDNRRLQQAGWLDNNNRPTADCLDALTVLANPDAEMDLLWGNAESVSLSKVYFSARSGKLVSFTRNGGNNNLSYFLSFQDITDLIAEKTAFPPIKEPAGISLEAGPAVLPVFLSVLDLYREGQLKAALERRQETAVSVTLDEINRVWQNSKTETNFGWFASAGYIAIASSLPASGLKIDEGFAALKREGVLNPDGTLSTTAAALASCAYPLMSFIGVKTTTRQGADLEKAHLALFRGFAALLFVQVSSENNQPRIWIKSISTSQLPEILFNLVTKPFDVKVQPQKPAPQQPPASPGNVNCAKCGTANQAGDKFCIKCGSGLTAASSAKFCMKCGSPLKIGAKFCEKCGGKVA
jgi:hypothetical protein